MWVFPAWNENGYFSRDQKTSTIGGNQLLWASEKRDENCIDLL